MMNKTESRQGNKDRYVGAMIGVAIGDALGAPLEFMDAGQIRRKYGEVMEMVGGGWLSVEPGEVTDDTQMTLAVAEGLVQAETELDEAARIGDNFLRWYAEHPKDVGNTCASVLSEMSGRTDRTMQEWQQAAERLCERTNGGTAGNGALMRTIYPALYFHDEWEAQNAAIRIGRMTHWHGMSDHTVRVYTELVNAIANSDMTAEEAKRKIHTAMQPFRGEAEDEGRIPPRPTGYCLDSLICATEAVLNTESFEDALVDAVNQGGDADTIGAIAGGLAGAVYGLTGIPDRWIRTLDNEPNRRTVNLFCPEDKRGVSLPQRLAELADLAWEKA